MLCWLVQSSYNDNPDSKSELLMKRLSSHSENVNNKIMQTLYQIEALNALPISPSSDHFSEDSATGEPFAKDVLLQRLDSSFVLLRGPHQLCKVVLPSTLRCHIQSTSQGLIHLSRELMNRFTVEEMNDVNNNRARCRLSATAVSGPVRSIHRILRSCLAPTEMLSFDYHFLNERSRKTQHGLDGEFDALEAAVDSFVGRHSCGQCRSDDALPIRGTVDDDWQQLLFSDLHRNASAFAAFSVCAQEQGKSSYAGKDMSSAVECSWSLHIEHLQRAQDIMLVLHDYFEDCKLDTTRWWLLTRLGKVLMPLAASLGAEEYVEHYLRSGVAIEMSVLAYLPEKVDPQLPEPADIHRALEERLRGLTSKTAAYQENAPPRALSHVDRKCNGSLGRARLLLQAFSELGRPNISVYQRACNVVNALVDHNLELCQLDSIPAGLLAPIRGALSVVAAQPPKDLPDRSYHLMQRWDLMRQSRHIQAPYERPIFECERERSRKERAQSMRRQHKVWRQGNPLATAKGDGMDHMLASVGRLRFQDMRVLEVKRLLSSSQVYTIKPGVSVDGESTDETNIQQQQLYLNALRTTSLPVGRGAFTAFTYRPSLTEPIEVPQLNLHGRVPDQNNANVNLDWQHAGVDSNFSLWPCFHNGVAAGLRIAHVREHLERTSVVFNRPQDPSHLHAGTLLALGLTGNLAALSPPDVYGYLKQEHDATNAALLIGLASTNRATMDQSVSKVCFLHLPAKHPPSYPDLEVPSIVQSAALFAVGLLYQGSAQRLMCEMLLSEVTSRPSTHPADSGSEQEEHTLSAGMALGFVTLGCGRNAAGVEDLGLEETLSQCIHGGKESMITSHRYDFWNSAAHLNDISRQGSGGQNSGLVIESALVNTDVVSPGAIVALGLMFLKTNERGVASRINIPSSHYELAHIRPDFAMLRSLSRGLVMWDSVQASKEWLHSTVPSILRGSLFEGISDEVRFSGADVEAMVQADANITAGSCLCMGLRFAGTANQRAAVTLHEFTEKFLSMKQKGSMYIDRSALESCADTCALALGLVMAGTGDLRALRLLRRMHDRLEQTKSGGPAYGQHLAVGMSIGFLFLGGGAYSFSNDISSIATLLAAIFPKFPTKTGDHKQHLQILRHMYVLAMEYRLLTINDAITGAELPSSVAIEVAPCDANAYEGGTHSLRTPCLLPPKNGIVRLRAEAAVHLPVSLEGSALQEALSAGRILVKRVELPSPRPGMSYLDNSVTSSEHRVTVHRWQGPTFNIDDDDAATMSNLESPLTGSGSLGAGLDELLKLCSHFQHGQWAESVYSALQCCATAGKPELASVHLSLLSAADDAIAVFSSTSPVGKRSCIGSMQSLQIRMVALAKSLGGITELCENALLQPWLVEAQELRLEAHFEESVGAEQLRSFVYASRHNACDNAQRAAAVMNFYMAPPSSTIRSALDDCKICSTRSDDVDDDIRSIARALMLRSGTCSAQKAVAIASALVETHANQSANK